MDLEKENVKLKECTKQLTQLLAEAQQKLKSIYEEREYEKAETKKSYAAAKKCIFLLRGQLQESLQRNETAEKLNMKLNAEMQMLQAEINRLKVESKNYKEDQSVNEDRLSQKELELKKYIEHTKSEMQSKLLMSEEALQLALVQAETFKNDFKLERESREKLNDVKLQLEQTVQVLTSQMRANGIEPNDIDAILFNGESASGVTETDSKEENRCFLCQKIISDATQLNQHVMKCLERMED